MGTRNDRSATDPRESILTSNGYSIACPIFSKDTTLQLWYDFPETLLHQHRLRNLVREISETSEKG